jgi:hypothetical protein
MERVGHAPAGEENVAAFGLKRKHKSSIQSSICYLDGPMLQGVAAGDDLGVEAPKEATLTVTMKRPIPNRAWLSWRAEEKYACRGLG